MALNPKRIGAIILRQYYLMRGSPARVLPLFAWVAIDIVLWGYITHYLNTVAAASFDFVPLLLGAVLMWDFFTRVMQGVTTTFFEDVWSRNFLNLFATPISVSEYVTGLVITSVITSLFGLVMMVVLASAVFGLSFLAFGLLLVPFLTVLFLFGIALGIFSSAIVLRLGPAAEWLIWPIPALLSPFAAVFYPMDVLPSWMRGIAYLLPPSYVFESMRAILAGNPFSTSALAWSVILAMGYVLLAGGFFVQVYRHAVRTGVLARYSAETVT